MPEDNQFECTIVGNGTQTQFQLYKQIYTSRIPIQHTLATESEDPLMWSNPNNEMWSIQVLRCGIFNLRLQAMVCCSYRFHC